MVMMKRLHVTRREPTAQGSRHLVGRLVRREDRYHLDYDAQAVAKAKTGGRSTVPGALTVDIHSTNPLGTLTA